MYAGRGWRPRRKYSGPIEIDEWILRYWIPRHASFASKTWIEQEVRWREWKWKRKSNRFMVFTQTGEGAFQTEVIFEVEDCGTHLFVWKAHAKGKQL
jgi:hypothetical protein